MRIGFLLVSSILVACSSSEGSLPSATASSTSPKSPSGSSSAASTEKPLCDKAQALRDRLGHIDTNATRLSMKVHAPVSDDGGPAPRESVVLELGDGMAVAGHAVHGLGDLSGELGRFPNRAVVIAMDVSAKAKSLSGVLGALAPGTDVYFAAIPKGAKPEPAPAAIAKEASTSDQSERARSIAKALQSGLSSCKPAEKVFQSLAGQGGNSAETLKRELPRAVDACECKVDDGFVES